MIFNSLIANEVEKSLHIKTNVMQEVEHLKQQSHKYKFEIFLTTPFSLLTLKDSIYPLHRRIGKFFEIFIGKIFQCFVNCVRAQNLNKSRITRFF